MKPQWNAIFLTFSKTFKYIRCNRYISVRRLPLHALRLRQRATHKKNEKENEKETKGNRRKVAKKLSIAENRRIDMARREFFQFWRKRKKERKKMGEKAVVPKFSEVLKMKGTIARFEEVLGSRTASFIASLLTIWTEDKKLQECDVKSILSAAKQAAILNLPIMKQLGYAYVIPYKDWKTGTNVATFQIGYKGLLQLAMRSGVFKNLNTVEIYEGELKSRNRITGEIELDETASTTGKVIGYAAYMELTNGFKKMYYMTREEVEAHAQKYSQSYAYDLKNNKKTSVWSTNFNAMATKTVMKLLLSKYAPTSIEMQGKDLVSAMQADQAAITPEGEYVYVDNGGEMKPSRDNFNEFAPETIDAETGEVKQEEIEVPFD